MDKNSIRKIIEDHIRALEGAGFQDFCDRLGLTLYEGDYTPVRPGGSKGDMKNDGYCPTARLFFAAHATRGEQASATKLKIQGDLEGCLEKHTDVRTWVYLTNDTLTGEIEHYIDEDLRPAHTSVAIETWDHKKIANKIYELPIEKIEYILDISLVTQTVESEGPYVDLEWIGPSGGSEGHFENITIKNIGTAAAIDCRVSIVGDNYEWTLTDDPRFPKTLDPGQSMDNIRYKISDEVTFDQDVHNLKLMLEYEDAHGKSIVTERELKQQRVKSGLFFNLIKGGRLSTTAIKSATTSIAGQATPSTQNSQATEFTLGGFEKLVESAQWTKELINNQDVWVCSTNALFQIVLEGDSEEFSEPWTQVYPDKLGSGKYTASLKINGTIIKQILIVWCDGGRIRVPLPRVKTSGDDRIFYWSSDSLEFKLGKLIGNFYSYGTIEGVAAMSNIEII